MVYVTKIWIFVGFWSLFLRVAPQLTYTIGIQSQFFTDANLTLNMSTGISIKYESITIIDSENINSLTTETQRLFSLGLDYLIYVYNQTASMATNNIFYTNNRIVPYLILPELIDDPIMNPNMFYIEYQEKMASDATRALLTYLNASTIVYIDYGPNPTSKNLVAFNNFGQILAIVNTGSPWPSVLQTVFRNNDQRFYVCAIPFTQSELITNLLTEGMFKGQLNPGKVWIFNHVTSNPAFFNTFQPFARVGADIYSFGITFPGNIINTNITTLQQYVARDYVRAIARSINNTVTKPSNLSQTLLNSILPLGELVINAGFSANNNQVNGTTINVLKVNTSPTPLQKFTYTNTLIEVNAANITRSLNHSLITVRIGMVPMKAYFMPNGQNGYYGYSVAVLNELRKLSNFQYSYVFPSDNLTGEVVYRNSSGAFYSGIVSLLQQDLADISLIPMIPINIGDVIFASDSVMTIKMNMISRTPDQALDFTLIFVPFSYMVWLGILLIIFIMTLAFWTINKISPNHSKTCAKEKQESYSFGYSFLVIYSSFVTAKLKIKPRQPSLHIFAFILWFSTLTFVITYASNMLPFLMVPNQAYPFKNATNLLPNNITLQNTTFKWGFVRNSIEQEIIKNDTVLSALFNIASVNWSSNLFFDDLYSETALSIDKFILIQNDNKNGYLYNRICNSSIFTGTSKTFAAVFIMSKTWKQRFEMSNLIKQIIASGALNIVDNRYFNLGPCATSQSSVTAQPKALTLFQTVGLFLIPSAGIVLGLLCTILQVIINKIQRCMGNMKMNKFVYGDVYESTIHSIENNGVWALINGRDRPYFISSTSLHPDLRKKYTIKELNIQVNNIIQLKYFGKDPVNGYKRFCREYSIKKGQEINPNVNNKLN